MINISNIIDSVPLVIVLVFSVVFHEVAHGKVALWKGDTTARDAGRLTLNPLSHIDIFGTILFPLFLIITGQRFLFGWAKPVPVNPMRFKDPKKDMAMVGLAGPVSNFLLALLAGFLLRLFIKYGANHVLIQTLYFAVMINLVLTFFNLIPIPPLDGSRIVMALLPDELAEQYNSIGRYGFIIIFALFFLGAFRYILFPIVNVFLVLIIGNLPLR